MSQHIMGKTMFQSMPEWWVRLDLQFRCSHSGHGRAKDGQSGGTPQGGRIASMMFGVEETRFWRGLNCFETNSPGQSRKGRFWIGALELFVEWVHYGANHGPRKQCHNPLGHRFLPLHRRWFWFDGYPSKLERNTLYAPKLMMENLINGGTIFGGANAKKNKIVSKEEMTKRRATAGEANGFPTVLVDDLRDLGGERFKAEYANVGGEGEGYPCLIPRDGFLKEIRLKIIRTWGFPWSKRPDRGFHLIHGWEGTETHMMDGVKVRDGEGEQTVTGAQPICGEQIRKMGEQEGFDFPRVSNPCISSVFKSQDFVGPAMDDCGEMIETGISITLQKPVRSRFDSPNLLVHSQNIVDIELVRNRSLEGGDVAGGDIAIAGDEDDVVRRVG
ncbi:hypothetical protein Acr_00g0039860 [Actinidia rufa]|uniref:Uncharacterized protein n=1 Tax=Actinidia rufa TaxID=165716 RepID=A0A7J0DHP2_9ERIC|nr:hypothetical protein Acr_00g0039860 [Actinidia rufa]